MKKLIITLATLSLLLGGCSSTTKGNDSNESKNKNTEMNVIELTKEGFLKKISNFEASADWKYLGDKPAIIDFYATWCGPCKAIAPILEELAEEFKDDIYIYKIDTDKEQELAALFGIRSIPSLLFIPMEDSPQMSQGAVPKNDLKKAIEDILLKKK